MNGECDFNAQIAVISLKVWLALVMNVWVNAVMTCLGNYSGEMNSMCSDECLGKFSGKCKGKYRDESEVNLKGNGTKDMS